MVTSGAGKRRWLNSSGQTHQRVVDLTRCVGRKRSIGAVKPTTDGSRLNAEVIATSAKTAPTRVTQEGVTCGIFLRWQILMW